MVLRILILLVSLAPGLLAATTADGWYQEARELYYGVPVQVRFQGGDALLAERVWASLEAVDAVFNDYRDDSEVSRINSGGPGRYPVSADLQTALELAFRVHVISDGAFDITVGPLRRLWKGAAASGQLPAEAAIAAARRRVGLRHVFLQGDRVELLRDGVALDFGGLIKGMAVDRAMAILQAAGVEHAMVQVGGETAAMGISLRGRPHAFGIPDPQDPRQMLQVVQDPGAGYSGCTSGNYLQPIIIDGQPYYHIFDPRTGRPCDLHILSVSVIFPEVGRNGLADALSTSGVVLGPERLAEVVEALGGSCLVISADGNGVITRHASAGWERFVRHQAGDP